MIGYLRGKILDSGPDSLLLDVGGVGYQLAIPLSTYSELDRVDRAVSVGLFVHTHVRADAIELFGFWTARERQLFELLISVSGIGPRLARTVLSGMAAGDLVRSIASENAVSLATISGIGKKTAQRMVIELKDKVRDLGIDLSGSPVSADDDLLAALVNLGYRRDDAERALGKALQKNPDGDFEDLLRASLNSLSRA